MVENAYHALAIDERRTPFVPTLWMHKPKPGQTIEQVWFCGVHSDVGGGYPECGPSDIALDWMIDKARGVGLAFDAAAMQAIRCNAIRRRRCITRKPVSIGLPPALIALSDGPARIRTRPLPAGTIRRNRCTKAH